MSKTDDTSVNWEPYEAEIISLYVDQDHTLKATMTHMREKYGLRATYAWHHFAVWKLALIQWQ